MIFLFSFNDINDLNFKFDMVMNSICLFGVLIKMFKFVIAENSFFLMDSKVSV